MANKRIRFCISMFSKSPFIHTLLTEYTQKCMTVDTGTLKFLSVSAALEFLAEKYKLTIINSGDNRKVFEISEYDLLMLMLTDSNKFTLLEEDIIENTNFTIESRFD